MRFLRTTKRAFSCLLAVEICFALTGCGVVERKILYAPKPFPKSVQLPCDEMQGVHIEDASIESSDGMRLHGWYVAPTSTVPKQVVLFCHGRSGNITTFDSELVEFVRRHGVAVLAYDYRGYGKSEGKPGEESGIYRDARAARSWLVERTGSPVEDIVLMGRSLGAAVAIELAASDGAKALVVECGFTSFPDVVQHHTRNVLTGKRFKSKYNSIAKIARYSGPVFVSHGNDDKLIPFEHGVRLADSATQAERVEFVEVIGGHDMPASEPYKEMLSGFLATLPSDSRGL